MSLKLELKWRSWNWHQWKECEFKVKKRKAINVIVTSIIEYAWIYLHKQGSEYASDPKQAKTDPNSEYEKVLNVIIWLNTCK